MKIKTPLVIAAAIGLFVGPGFAQENEREEMGGMMNEHHAEMAKMHQKMEATWQKQDAELNQLVTQMNNAQGDQKVTAMAAVVTKLVELRKKEHDDMATMHEKMKGKMEGMMKDHAGMSPSPGEHSEHH